MIFGIYITLASKLFLISTVLLLSCIYLPLIMTEALIFWSEKEQLFSAPVTVLITVGLIFLSALAQYMLASLLYRRPLSKLAANWNLGRCIDRMKK